MVYLWSVFSYIYATNLIQVPQTLFKFANPSYDFYRHTKELQWAIYAMAGCRLQYIDRIAAFWLQAPFASNVIDSILTKD